jgi:hypothetical protein
MVSCSLKPAGTPVRVGVARKTGAGDHPGTHPRQVATSADGNASKGEGNVDKFMQEANEALRK